MSVAENDRAVRVALEDSRIASEKVSGAAHDSHFLRAGHGGPCPRESGAISGSTCLVWSIRRAKAIICYSGRGSRKIREAEG